MSLESSKARDSFILVVAVQCGPHGMALWVAAVICHCHLGVIHWYITGAAQAFCGGWSAEQPGSPASVGCQLLAPQLTPCLSFLI